MRFLSSHVSSIEQSVCGDAFVPSTLNTDDSVCNGTKRGSKNAPIHFLVRQRPIDQLAAYLMNSSMVYVYLREKFFQVDFVHLRSTDN